MRLIKKDIDKRLLILIMALVVVIISIIAFYEIRLGKILSGYDKNAEMYSWMNANAARLNKTLKLKDIALIDKKYLEAKYSELAAQNSKLLQDIKNLKSELVIAKSTEEYQKARDGGPVAQFRLIQEKNAEISELKEKADALCLKIKVYNSSAKEC